MKKQKDFKWVLDNEEDISNFIHILPRYEDGEAYINIHIGTAQDGFVFKKNIKSNYLYLLMEKLIEVSKAINNDKDTRNGH